MKLKIEDLHKEEDLTIEEARALGGCEDLTDEEVKEMLEVVKTFCDITYATYSKKKVKDAQENMQQII